jgi:hypothetical protein
VGFIGAFNVFNEGIPCATGQTAARPLRERGSTVGATMHKLQFGHVMTLIGGCFRFFTGGHPSSRIENEFNFRSRYE